MTNIVVALPSHGGNWKVQCTISVVALCSDFVANNIHFEIRNRDGAEIVESRNFFASMVLAQAERTHLLFVDYDMEFSPQAVFRMLQLARPVIGCAYPRKQTIKTIRDFVLDLSGLDQLHVVGGACRVTGIGMGLTLIERTALEQLASTGQLRRATPDKNAPNAFPIYGFFDPIITTAKYMSEDLSFCRRWTSLCQGEVWALVDQEIGHVGAATYKGRMIDYVDQPPAS